MVDSPGKFAFTAAAGLVTACQVVRRGSRSFNPDCDSKLFAQAISDSFI